VSLAALGRGTLGAVRVRMTGRRVPLTVHWSVTNRCDALCAHCAHPFRTPGELPTKTMLSLVDEIADAGAQRVVLTGGEPLSRPDLHDIVDHCIARGLFVRLETNGYRWPERAGSLARVGHLVVSYDGDAAAHDAIHEPGSWRRAWTALEDASRRSMRLSVLTVLTRHNLDEVEGLLRSCERWAATAEFRLLHHNRAFDGGASARLAPDDAALRRTLRWILDARRSGRPVENTEKALRTMLEWDDYRALASPSPRDDQLCLAGQTHAYLDADGTLFTCHQRVGATRGVPAGAGGFLAAWNALVHDDCQACGVSDLCERNHVDNLNPPALLGAIATARLGWRRGERPDPASR
jgi:MoaA/NifB/PqqE/SkfB family radical SAM enzyme